MGVGGMEYTDLSRLHDNPDRNTAVKLAGPGKDCTGYTITTAGRVIIWNGMSSL
jgi:hypothetical protein